MVASPPAIAFETVDKSFDGGRVLALSGVSLSVARCEFRCIVGGSGSGKTTLLRLANRLIAPDKGRILVDGADIAGRDPVSLRRSIGTVFQNAALFPHMTVAENIGITPRLKGTPRTEIEARVDELLGLIRLDAARYRNRFPHELSGGERQRVGVARALAAKPSIVLMDEPFGALDPLTRDALSEEFRDLHRSLKLTTILITHDMTEAMLLADRIAVMKEGRLIADGNTGELVSSNDAYVRDLMRTPRRQTERLNALLGQAGQP